MERTLVVISQWTSINWQNNTRPETKQSSPSYLMIMWWSSQVRLNRHPFMKKSRSKDWGHAWLEGDDSTVTPDEDFDCKVFLFMLLTTVWWFIFIYRVWKMAQVQDMCRRTTPASSVKRQRLDNVFLLMKQWQNYFRTFSIRFLSWITFFWKSVLFTRFTSTSFDPNVDVECLETKAKVKETKDPIQSKRKTK